MYEFPVSRIFKKIFMCLLSKKRMIKQQTGVGWHIQYTVILFTFLAAGYLVRTTKQALHQGQDIETGKIFLICCK